MSFDYSIIISVGIEEYGRGERAIHCINSFKYQTVNRKRYEVILVEQALTGHYLNDVAVDMYIPLHDPQERGCSKNWGFNVASKLARSNKLVLVDSDIVVPSDYIECLDTTPLTNFAFGGQYYIWSNEVETTEYMGRMKTIEQINFETPNKIRSGVLETNFNGIGLGLIAVFDKEFYLNEYVGGVENMIVWGWDDTLQASMVSRICYPDLSVFEGVKKFPKVPSYGMHLWHGDDRPVGAAYNSMGNFYHFYKQDYKEVLAKLRSANIGDMNEPKFIS